MVSALWKACSDGDIESVHEFLKNATAVDIEIKGMIRSIFIPGYCPQFPSVIPNCFINFSYSDHTGVTPLIEAVKNGHLEVVRALLDRGESLIES
jgi:ankyrin repeat protein